MRIDVLTIFSDCYSGLKYGIIAKALEKGIFELNIHDIRDYSKDKHKRVDDYPYGGGAGMLMTPQPLFDAINCIDKERTALRILLSPRGKTLNQNFVKELAKEERIMLINGAYEGIDQRIIDSEIDLELSIGDYVLTSGDLASMVVINAVARYIEGVLGSEASTQEESFSKNRLEYPQYTRPETFMGVSVPEVLLSGNHKEIELWRKQKSEEITKKTRPDLMED